MELRRLRYFVAVAEHENFHRAADAVHIAQSALSKHVRELAERIGAPLFERTPRGVRLTMLGAQLYEEAKYLLDRLDGVYERTRKTAAGEISRLSVGVNDLSSHYHLVIDCICAFRERHPGIELDFVRMDSNQQLAALQSGKLDIGMIVDRPAEATDLDFLEIGSDPIVVALPRSHPLAERTTLSVAELNEQPFVHVRPAAHHVSWIKTLVSCRAIAFQPNYVMEASTELMQIAFIRKGIGFGLVVASMRDRLPEDVVLRPVEHLDLLLDIDLVWAKGTKLKPLANFIDIFRELKAGAQ